MTNPDDVMADRATRWLAYYNHRDMFDGMVPVNTASLIVESSINDELRKQANDFLKYILATPFTVGGGVCKECEGEKEIDKPDYFGEIYPQDCPACNGTGRKNPTVKTLQEWLEWIGEKLK